MIGSVTLKKPLTYPNGLRERVQAFNRSMFDKYWAPLIPLADFPATIGTFTVIAPTDDEKQLHDELVRERETFHESIAAAVTTN